MQKKKWKKFFYFGSKQSKENNFCLPPVHELSSMLNKLQQNHSESSFPTVPTPHILVSYHGGLPGPFSAGETPGWGGGHFFVLFLYLSVCTCPAGGKRLLNLPILTVALEALDTCSHSAFWTLVLKQKAADSGLVESRLDPGRSPFSLKFLSPE